uniref:Tc1-like transposase DDE domain-containing protein n=1 Tax=Pygocentrus nattereri TaxID=42514 RepID=A0AAR2LDW7_PYGNA
MGKQRDLSTGIVAQIQALRQPGLTQTKIAEQLGISQSSVCKALKKNCSKRTNCSGVRKTSARDNKLGFKSRVPAVKPMLNKKQKEKRLKWAKEHSEWTAEDWQKVVFSDESRFCISFGDQGPRVWRRGGETYNHECVKRSVKFPQSVMVWGCMSARGVGKLCFLKKTVNAAVYQDILETFLIPTVEEQFGEEDFIFQQDLAPAHAAKSTKDWFTKKQLEVLAWPANSPDLNVIENLWAIVKRKIRDRKPTTLDQLKQNIATAWEAVSAETCDKLVKSMPRRLQAVIQAKGAATKY